MPYIDTADLKLGALIAYDDMTVECTPKVENFAPLAVSIWSDVMDQR
jgi:hypothetical protein